MRRTGLSREEERRAERHESRQTYTRERTQTAPRMRSNPEHHQQIPFSFFFYQRIPDHHTPGGQFYYRDREFPGLPETVEHVLILCTEYDR